MAIFTYTWETIFSHKDECRTAAALGTWRGLLPIFLFTPECIKSLLCLAADAAAAAS
jgi:hypothetical protein